MFCMHLRVKITVSNITYTHRIYDKIGQSLGKIFNDDKELSETVRVFRPILQMAQYRQSAFSL